MSSCRRFWVGGPILVVVLAVAFASPSFAQPPEATSSAPSAFLDLGTGLALFAAGREDGAEIVRDIWITDGTAAGTFPLEACGGDCGYPVVAVAAHGGRGYFAAHQDLFRGPELYRTDGTQAGTVRLTDFGFDREAPTAGYRVLPGKGLLLFAVENWDLGPELWATDGTRAGTRLVVRGTVGARFDTFTGAVAGGRLYFWQRRIDGGPDALWVSDGFSAGSRELLPAVGLGGAVAAVGETAIVSFAPNGAACANEVHAVSGAAAPFLLHRFTGAACQGEPASLFTLPGGVYFWTAAREGRLFLTDGTPAGTRPLTEAAEDRTFHGVYTPIADGERLVFLADDGVHGAEIWEHRAGDAEARLLHETCAGACYLPANLVAAEGDAVYFTASEWPSPGSPPRLLVVDAAGVRQLADVLPLETERLGHHLFFTGPDDGGDHELWAVDLRTASARQLTDFVEPYAFGPDFHRGRFGEALLFAADDGIHGSEPWRSDGTAAGTRLIGDLVGSDQTPTGPPAVPPGLVVQVANENAVEITWGAAPGAQSYELDVRAPFDVVPSRESSRLAYVTGLDPGTPVTVRVRSVNAFGTSAWSDPVHATTWSRPHGEPCADDDTTLCLRQGRFRIEVDWRNQHGGGRGPGRALRAAGSDRSGYFWFFKPDNVELIVKLLDGSGVNGWWWTFYGALSDVEYWVTVTDTASSNTRTYHNPPGQICGRGDTASLAPSRVAPRSVVRRPPIDPEPVAASITAALPSAAAAVTGAVCVDDAETLCLEDGRFRVRVAWHDQHNDRDGTGAALPFTDRSGFFTFFDPENVELVVKVLDGRPLNGRFWLFYGALSDVRYTITVEDLVSGISEQYVNEPGSICGHADTARFTAQE